MVVAVETAATAVSGVKKADVREEFYRASGKGGQNRNKVSTAVRLTHQPSGLVAIANEERTQGKNRTVAWARLEEKFAELQADEQKQKADSSKARQFVLADAWTWVDYADEVRSPGGARYSMKQALKGKLDSLLR